MDETCIDTFEELLHETVQQLLTAPNTQQFAQYFQQFYYFRAKQWALCYRQKSGINTNMYVEVFHHVLKYIYMKGRVNKRVYKCVDMVKKIARDKAFDRLIKLQKGKFTHKFSSIKTRHRASLNLPLNLATENGQDDRTAHSSSTSDQYHVTQLTSQCSKQHCLQCHDCNI